MTMPSDAREAGRVVATVLLAAGPPVPALVQHANHGLMRLSLPALQDRDFTMSTPEELAPVIPPQLHHALGDLMLELSEGEPLRRRVALAYLGLWKIQSHAAQATSTGSTVTEKIARAMIGDLPRHQGVQIPEEKLV